MSFKDCIDNAEKEGVISPDRAKALRERYRAYADQLQLDYGADAAAEAARRTFAEMTAEAARRKRLKLLQAARAGALAKAQDGFRNFRGETDFGEFMVNLIEDVGGKAGVSTVNGRYRAVLGRAHSRMAAVIQRFERDALGRTRNRPLLDDMVRALFGGEATGEAKMLADAWSDAAEFLRLRFNAAGGEIGKLDKWGLPQSHDGVAVARAGFATWRDFVMARIDIERMPDRDTGKPFTAQKLELVLRDAFDAITTEGWSKIEPSGAAGGKSLANRRADARFLIFRDGDAWLEYQRTFGNGDAFSAMTAHLDGMARDVAAMEILGPNPAATLRYLEQRTLKRAAEMDAKEPGRKTAGVFNPFADDARGKTRVALDMFRLFNGSGNRPVSGFAARVLVNTRSVLTSAQLGSATLSAVTDAHTQALTRKFNGMARAGAFDVLADVGKALFTGRAADGRIAVRAGLIADGAAQIGMAQARYLGDLHARGVARWMADTALRVSGLSPWTQGGRWAFGMEMMGAMAERARRSLDALGRGDDLDRAFARALDRYGLAGSWDDIRKAALYEPADGARFLRPEDVAAIPGLPPRRAQELADRLLEMIQSETEFAVPTASLRAQATLQGGTAKGTLAGELIGSVTMYKSFPTTIAYLTASRTMAEGAARGDGGGAAYAASVIFGMTVFGAVAVQMKNLAAGRDPQDMTDEKFWLAALVQGGGLGIFGDFLFAQESRAGGGLAATIAGPVVGLVEDARSLTIGNAIDAVQGEDPRVGRDAVRFLRGYTPFGNVWYWRAAYQRAVLDNLQRMVDPDAERYFRRQSRQRELDYGQEYFWGPGETLPSRGPAFEAALGAAPR